MCDSQSLPWKNYHRGLVKGQVDANQASAVHSLNTFGRTGDCESCTPNNLVWDEYGRVVGVAGVKNAAWGGCEHGVHSAEYRMNVETATRPSIPHSNPHESFDNLRLGRDIKDLTLSKMVECGKPQPTRSYAAGHKTAGALNKRRYN